MISSKSNACDTRPNAENVKWLSMIKVSTTTVVTLCILFLVYQTHDDLQRSNHDRRRLPSGEGGSKRLGMFDSGTDPRARWKEGSKVKVYSASAKKWFKGKVIEVMLEDFGWEWLNVEYEVDGAMKRKDVNRFDNKTIKPTSKQRSQHGGARKHKSKKGSHSPEIRLFNGRTTHYSDVVQTGTTCWLYARMAAIAAQHPGYFKQVVTPSEGCSKVDLHVDGKMKSYEVKHEHRATHRKIRSFWPQIVAQAMNLRFNELEDSHGTEPKQLIEGEPATHLLRDHELEPSMLLANCSEYVLKYDDEANEWMDSTQNTLPNEALTKQLLTQFQAGNPIVISARNEKGAKHMYAIVGFENSRDGPYIHVFDPRNTTKPTLGLPKGAMYIADSTTFRMKCSEISSFFRCVRICEWSSESSI